MKYKKAIFVLFIIIFISSFHHIQVSNEDGLPTKAEISIKLGVMEVFSFHAKNMYVILPFGKFTIEVDKEGFDKEIIDITNINPIKKYNKEKVVLKVKYIDLQEHLFMDPTGTIQLTPLASIKGTNILEKYVEANGLTKIPYGNYDVILRDPHFMRGIRLVGEDFLINNEEQESVNLEPARTTITLTEEEVAYTFNFLQDFFELSNEGYIYVNPGMPKQFYLERPDIVLSQGDMVFLFCQAKVYEQQEKTPTFFIPINKKYTIVNDVYNENDCYAHGLAGYIPKFIDATPTVHLFGEFYYEFRQDTINTKRKTPFAMTFDIESGRYVHEDKGPHAISPCTDEITRMGLGDASCDDADAVGWFSPIIENTQDLPYPWVSGILGTKDILGYTERYGVATTLFMVDKEIPVYEELAPEIMTTIQTQVDQGHAEIASHTVFHTKLGSASHDKDLETMKQSKEYLEKKFNTNVTGMRGPYFSFIGNSASVHEDVLGDIGYTYFSNEFTQEVGIPHVTSKPVNFYFLSWGDQELLQRKVLESGYVITIDHPWNFYYEEVEHNGDVYLQEDFDRAKRTHATMLVGIAEGGIPMRLDDVEVS